MKLFEKVGGTRLTPVRFSRVEWGGRGTTYKSYFIFKCDCGEEKEICKYDVRPKRIRSCGCLKRELWEKNRNKGLPFGHKFSKKNSGSFKDGQTAPNKGRVKIVVNGKIRYVTEEKLTAMYYGEEGEIESAREREAPNKGKKLLGGKYA